MPQPDSDNKAPEGAESGLASIAKSADTQMARLSEGSGDLSSPVLIGGHDEFAALGAEFNSMSR